MKKYFLIPFLLLCLLTQAQQYPFLSTSYLKVNNFEFNNLLQKKPVLSYFLENGKEANKTYFDSIKQVKSTQFEQLFYADTLQNKVAIVTRIVSEKEQKERNKKFFKY